MGGPRDSDGLAALREGRGFLDLRRWRKVLVAGRDASTFLHDLVSADVAGLGPGRARRSLLLAPTGHIRADLTVARLSEGFLLVQDPAQPDPVDRLLAPYVLSADVRLEDRSEALRVVALPGGRSERATRPPPAPEGWEAVLPSCLGPGTDLVGPAGGPLPEFAASLVEATEEDLERWRVERGTARFPIDLSPRSLPQEAGLDDAIDYTKGCFLGQEALARVRNLGHPPFVVLALRATEPLEIGSPVVADGRPVGEVTSAAPIGGETALIARVRWAARDAELSTRGGSLLFVAGPATGAP